MDPAGRKARQQRDAARPADPRAASGDGFPAIGLLLVFVLALVLRVGYVLTLRGTPVGQLLVLDAATYDAFAHRILAGTFRGEDVYAMNALYPWFVAAIYRVAHAAPFAVHLAQAALDAGTCTLVAWMAARLVSAFAGIVAGGMALLFPTLIFYCGTLLTPTLVTFLCTAGVAALVRAADPRAPRAGWAAAAGLALGLATLGRGNNLLFLPLGFAVFAAARGARASLAPYALFAVAFLAPVLAITARNFAIEGRFVPVAANYAALYVGHNAQATGFFVAPPWIHSGEFAQEVDAVRAAVGRELGHPVTLAESARWLFGQALRFAATHPAEEARLLWVKLRGTASWIESPTNLNLAFAQEWSPFLASLRPWSVLLAPFALVGAWATWSRRRALVPVWIGILVPLVTCVLVFVGSEYRVPMVPFLCVLAGGTGEALARIHSRRRNREAVRDPAAWRPWAWTFGLLALGVVVALQAPAALVRQADVSGDDVNFGTVYARRGAWPMAERLYERGVAANPRNGYAWQGLAVSAAQLGDTTRAIVAEESARRLGAIGR